MARKFASKHFYIYLCFVDDGGDDEYDGDEDDGGVDDVDVCRHILSGGGRVFFTDLSSERGERTKAELVAQYGSARLDFTQQDVADCDQWRQVWLRAEQFFGGEVEALCNNAGIYETYQSTNTNIINVNLLGVVYGTNLAMEKMSAERGGLIVQISSMAGLVTTSASPLYCSSKAGVLAYLRSHRTTGGLRMVAVCPCLTDTPLIREVLGRADGELLTSQYGMRSLTTREVAQAFQKAVLSGAPGSALLVHPEVSFYWPETGLVMFNFYCLAARILLQVGYI